MGMLVLLISGQLTWGDLIPLAMLLSNTYGAALRTARSYRLHRSSAHCLFTQHFAPL